MFIEALLERAERAEQQLLLSAHTRHTQKHTLTGGYAPGQGGRGLDGSDDDVITDKMQGAIGNRVRQYEKI